MTRPSISTLFTLLLAATLLATATRAEEAVPRIDVSGEGKVHVAPDIALLSLTVTREAEGAKQALDANSAAMAKVMAAMQAQGIAERDLQTTGFSIQPKMVYPRNNQQGESREPRIVGYTVRNTLNVRVRDIARVGEILEQSVTLGVNQGGNISFSNDDPQAALDRARVLATKDAMARARTLAAAAGVKLGTILRISESTEQSRPMPMARAEFAMAADTGGAVPVAAGENTYTARVSISYAIEQ